MGQPAARLGDMHICPMWSGNIPHVGGPILPACKPNVLIGGSPAARVGDRAYCNAPPDVIVQGSATVLIGGQMAARLGDRTAHGGVIVVGDPTVLIGDEGEGKTSGANSDRSVDPPNDVVIQSDPLAGQQPFVDDTDDADGSFGVVTGSSQLDGDITQEAAGPPASAMPGTPTSPGAAPAVQVGRATTPDPLLAVGAPSNTPTADVVAGDVDSVPVPAVADASAGPSLRPGLSQSWLSPDGSPAWPGNDGFAEPPVDQQLSPGGPNLGRFGSPGGSFFTQAGTPFENLSLPYDPSTISYTEYQVMRPFSVAGGTAAPYFDQPGGGQQFMSDKSAGQLVDEGFLREVPAAGSPTVEPAEAPVAGMPATGAPATIPEPMPLVEEPIFPEIFIP